MSRRPGIWPVAIVLAALLPSALDALPPAKEADREVVFYAPSEHKPAFGDTVVEVDVYADDVVEVIFLVDGEEIDRLAKPPYKLTVPLGDSFAAHRFEAIAMGAQGELVRGTLETPALRIDEQLDLDLRQLYVTVESSGEQPPTALERQDFEVLDNGVPQSIVTFERGDAAITVGLLVDASDSMRGGHLEAALDGVRSFIGGMRELDEAAVYLFSDSIRFRSPFLQQDSGLREALSSVEPGGGTALNDALFLAIRQLEERQGRRVVVLLSDGSDIHSALGMRDVLWSMQRSRSLVYWIELNAADAGVDKTSPWRSSERYRMERQSLYDLVTESGGRVVPISTSSEAARAFQEILAELRRQYVLGYYPHRKARQGGWHSVDVKVGRKGHRTRTRNGYVAN